MTNARNRMCRVLASEVDRYGGQERPGLVAECGAQQKTGNTGRDPQAAYRDRVGKAINGR